MLSTGDFLYVLSLNVKHVRRLIFGSGSTWNPIWVLGYNMFSTLQPGNKSKKRRIRLHWNQAWNVRTPPIGTPCPAASRKPTKRRRLQSVHTCTRHLDSLMAPSYFHSLRRWFWSKVRWRATRWPPHDRPQQPIDHFQRLDLFMLPRTWPWLGLWKTWGPRLHDVVHARRTHTLSSLLPPQSVTPTLPPRQNNKWGKRLIRNSRW